MEHVNKSENEMESVKTQTTAEGHMTKRIFLCFSEPLHWFIYLTGHTVARTRHCSSLLPPTLLLPSSSFSSFFLCFFFPSSPSPPFRLALSTSSSASPYSPFSFSSFSVLLLYLTSSFFPSLSSLRLCFIYFFVIFPSLPSSAASYSNPSSSYFPDFLFIFLYFLPLFPSILHSSTSLFSLLSSASSYPFNTTLDSFTNPSSALCCIIVVGKIWLSKKNKPTIVNLTSTTTSHKITDLPNVIFRWSSHLSLSHTCPCYSPHLGIPFSLVIILHLSILGTGRLVGQSNPYSVIYPYPTYPPPPTFNSSYLNPFSVICIRNCMTSRLPPYPYKK